MEQQPSIAINTINNSGTINFNLPKQKNTEEIDFQLLHIIGNSVFGMYDALSLKRAGIVPQTLENCTQEKYTNYINSANVYESLPKFWHISSHADAHGLELFDGKISILDFSKNLAYSSIDVLFLDSCESTNIAANIVGLANNIICCLNIIYNEDAANAAYLFWLQYKQSKNISQSFEIVKQRIPHISNNIFLLSK